MNTYPPKDGKTWRSFPLQEARLLFAYMEAPKPPEQVSVSETSKSSVEPKNANPTEKAKRTFVEKTNGANAAAQREQSRIEGAPQSGKEKKERPITEKDVARVEKLKNDPTLKNIKGLTDKAADQKLLERHYLAMNGYMTKNEGKNVTDIERTEGFAQILSGIQFAMLAWALFGNKLKELQDPKAREEKEKNLPVAMQNAPHTEELKIFAQMKDKIAKLPNRDGKISGEIELPVAQHAAKIEEVLQGSKGVSRNENRLIFKDVTSEDVVKACNTFVEKLSGNGAPPSQPPAPPQTR